MVKMNKLNPNHSQFAPVNASIEKNKIASGFAWSKLRISGEAGDAKGAGAVCRSRTMFLPLLSAPAPVLSYPVAAFPASHIQSAVSER
jgi:hypothetical protein